MKKIYVACAIVESNGLYLIAKRKIGKLLENKWEFPGGKIELGESAEECLIREFQEELRVTINVGEFFAETSYKYDFGNVKIVAYLATLTDGNMVLGEHSEIRWIEANQLDSYNFVPADKPFIKKIKSLLIR